MVKLADNMKQFILRWGEMATHWGLNRTEAQIHALLFIYKEPLNAEDIATTLSVARSNVSNSLKELQQWGIVKPVHVLGDRRAHFESMRDVWDMFRVLVEEQKRREINPVIDTLRTTVADLEKGGDPFAKQKLGEMLEFFETMSRWHDDFRPIKTKTVRKFMKMGSKVIRLLGLN